MNIASPAVDRLSCVVGLCLTSLMAALVLYLFHDHSWLPHDDGAYALVAERLLSGEVLNRDVQDVHMGYVNFANAAALRVFGMDLVSLRYPLVLMGLVQSGVVFLLVYSRGLIPATAASTAMTVFSFVQFPNPTANWYCLFLFVVLVALLTWVSPTARGRLQAIGLLLMTILLFRQLTGVLAAIGTLTYLLSESDSPGARPRYWLGRCLILVMAFGLFGYLFVKTDAMAILLYGSWPLALLGCAWKRAVIDDRNVLRMMLQIGIGALVALAPLLAYHVANQSLNSWFYDTVIAAEALTRIDFFDQLRYSMFVVTGVRQLLNAASPSEVWNGIFWATLPLVATCHGAVVVAAVWTRRAAQRVVAPLPFLAVFYAIVSLHFQASMYLFYVLGLTLSGLLYMTAESRQARRWLPVAVVALAMIAIYYHAGQSMLRGEFRIVQGERCEFVRLENQRCTLWLPREEVDLYTQLLNIIQRETNSQDTVLALPVNPELCFLSGRKSPVRFFNSALGLRDSQHVRQVQQQLAERPPKLVFYRPNQLYTTALTRQLMQSIRDRYELLEEIGEFEVYRLTSVADEDLVAVHFSGEAWP